MSWDLNGQTANVEQALAGGSPQRAGWFRFYFADQRWEWSEQVQRMHGYEPGTVTPTTELVLEHKHPEDRGQVATTIDEILDTHQAFSTRHRIIDTTDRCTTSWWSATSCATTKAMSLGHTGFMST